MEWYPKVLRWINSAFPTLRLTRKRNLTRLTHAILKKRTLCQAELARAWPGQTIHRHKKKQLHRFAKNEALRPLTLLAQLIPKVCHRFGFAIGRVPLALDWTPLRPEEQGFFAALPCQGRSLPLLGWATSFPEIRQGPSQNDLEEAFVRRQALPPQAWPVLLADRGFGRVDFLRFLQGLGRVLGCEVSFVIRLPKGVTVTHQGQRRPLRDWPLADGQLIFLEGAYLRQDQAVRVNLVLYWKQGQKEPWYLATDLGDPEEAIRLYAQRAWIDEMFRDFKHRLGLEESQVASSARLERLMLGLMLAYLVLALVGLFAVGSRFVAEVISWGKGSFLFLGTLRVVFHLPYRQLEGLARGLKKLVGLPAPDYSTLSLRVPQLELDKGYEPQEGEPLVIAVDATGIKVTNRGEWRRRKRKGYVKIHVAVDMATKRAVSLEVSDERTHDSEKLKPLVREAQKRAVVAKALVDGGYDTKANFEFLEACGIEAAIKVGDDSSPQCEGPRGEVVQAKRWERMVQELHLKVWVYNLLIGLAVTPS